MQEVWNQAPYRQLRTNMLNDVASPECVKCIEQERHGFFSMRNDANRTYGHHVAEVDLTEPDGTNPQFNIRYWDVRFSNLCNFRCRSCSPTFSSAWFKDHVTLYRRSPDINGRTMASVEYTTGNEDDMAQQMLPHIPNLEQVYFAGGEPLIMKEHYFLLDKLLEGGRTDVRIIYNTNFSELKYKNKHVFDYWKQFKNVSVGASLDGSAERAELIRKGTRWSDIVANRTLMMDQVPHVDFYISATVSTMNALHVLDFHREWSELGLISPKDFNVNICQGPDWYRIDCFPESFKRNVVLPAYHDHIAWLKPKDSLERATSGFTAATKFMMDQDRSAHWNTFLTETEKLDQLRSEDFWSIFDEYRDLRP